jgi:hypothetical protein
VSRIRDLPQAIENTIIYGTGIIVVAIPIPQCGKIRRNGLGAVRILRRTGADILSRARAA